MKTTTSPATRTVDQVVDDIGLGRFQWILLGVCGLTWAADAMEVLLMAFALPGVSATFGIPRGAGTATVLLSATFAGMLVGALFWGWLADRVGRRRVFLTTVSLGIVFGFAGAFAPNVELLMLARVLTGFALGGTLPVDYAMMAEFVPTAWRGRFLVYLESFWALGTIAVAGLAWYLSTIMEPEQAWRWLLALTALPAVVGLLARIAVPDSPRSLLQRGHDDAALAALARVARVNQRPLGQIALVLSEHAKVRAGDLFSGEFARRTGLLVVAWFGLSLGYYGIFSWLPSYLRAQGMELGAVYQTTLVLALAQVPGYMLASVLVDRIGRRATVTAFLLGSAVGAYLFLGAGSGSSVMWTSAVMSFALLGAWGALYAYTPELFPTSVRTTGMGIASGSARLASVISPTVGSLLLTGNLGLALSVFAGCFVAAAAAAWFVGVETRGERLT